MADAKTPFVRVHDRLKESRRSSTDLGRVFDEQKAQEVATRQAETIKQALVETREDNGCPVCDHDSRAAKTGQANVMNHFVESFSH